MNLEKFYDVVRQLNPELYLILMALEQSKVNPMVLPRIIRAIGNMYLGTKHGRVSIYMVNGKITHVEGIERDEIKEEAIVED